MPRIVEYESKGTLTPNSEGYSAYEQAARRTGPLAQQSASDIEKLGRMASEAGSAASKFAYEYDSPFVSLLDKAAKVAAAPKERAGGTSKVQGGNGRDLIGTGAGASRDNNVDANERGQAVKYGGPDITRAAAALSRQANAQLNPKAAPGGGTVIGMDENGHPIIREKNGNIKTDESQTGQSINARGTDGSNVADINASSWTGGRGGSVGTAANPIPAWNGRGPQQVVNPPGNDAPNVGGMPSARSPAVELDPQTQLGWPKKGKKIAAGDAVDVEQGLGPEQGPLSQHAGGGVPEQLWNGGDTKYPGASMDNPADYKGPSAGDYLNALGTVATDINKSIASTVGGWFGSPFSSNTPADPVPTGDRTVIGGTVNDAGTWIPNQSVPMDPSVANPQDSGNQ